MNRTQGDFSSGRTAVVEVNLPLASEYFRRQLFQFYLTLCSVGGWPSESPKFWACSRNSNPASIPHWLAAKAGPKQCSLNFHAARTSLRWSSKPLDASQKHFSILVEAISWHLLRQHGGFVILSCFGASHTGTLRKRGTWPDNEIGLSSAKFGWIARILWMCFFASAVYELRLSKNCPIIWSFWEPIMGQTSWFLGLERCCERFVF